MKVVIASHNEHKITEFKRILEPMGFEIVITDLTEAEETGTTFKENAFIKAKSACLETNLPCIADDSGMCVNALNGEPGVYSARYAPKGQNKATVLKKLEGVVDRTGSFVSAISCVFPNGDIIEAEGICDGYIATKLMGDNGFGYDPIFMVGEKSFAQMSAKEKDEISHRGKALRDFKIKLEKYIGENNANK